MTIFFIVRGLPDKKSPQWGCFELDQAKALAKLGHKVVYISADSRFRLYHRKIGFTKQIIDGVITYNSFVMPSAIARLLGSTTAHRLRLWQLDKMIRRAIEEEGQPDVFYSQYLFVTNEAVELKQKYDVPLVAIEHWSELQKEALTPSAARLIPSYTKVDQLIAVCNSLQSAIQRHSGIKPIVVYNMVGNEFSYRPSQPAAKVRFVATGSLVRRKGFDLFAKAFALLNLPKDKWELTVIGEGEERINLQKQIEKNGFADNIHLAGSKNKTEIAKILNESDVFVLPSRNENFSVAVLEALACGLPVVASICGGIRECIDDKNGVLFEVDDVEALAKAIRYMYEHHQDYDRQAIADDCQARFSSKVIAKQLTQIFEEVINKP